MMDPEANLAEQRILTAEIIALRDKNGLADSMNGSVAEAISDRAGRLAELAQAMDQWLSKGGAFPRAWRDSRPHAPGAAAIRIIALVRDKLELGPFGPKVDILADSIDDLETIINDACPQGG
jgi:hypothetical protein